MQEQLTNGSLGSFNGQVCVSCITGTLLVVLEHLKQMRAYIIVIIINIIIIVFLTIFVVIVIVFMVSLW